MIFDKETVTSIAKDEVTETTIKGNPKFEWVDIVGIPQRPSELKSNLYLTTHSSGEGGWDYGFDRRPTAAAISRDKKGWHFGIESGTKTGGSEYLMARNLNNFSKILFDNVRNETNPFIIGVTGSVGKTTTVAFLEHIIHTWGMDVTRFYSKRLTPLSVMCHYINRVEKSTPFVVMEYSAYMNTHVAELAKLLPPNIAFLTNIYETHMNPGMFESKTDIYNSKIAIKPNGSLGFINKRVVEELNTQVPNEWQDFEVNFPENNLNKQLPPTLRTAEMYTVGKLLCENLNISPETLDIAYRSFNPAEKRIVNVNYRGKNIFFHGETSGGSRLYSWFETQDGVPPWFMVENIDFADEDPQGFKNLLEKVFSSDKTFVLDTLDNRKKLPVSAQFINEEDFRKTMRDSIDGYAVYHKSLAVRQPDFDPSIYLMERW